MLYTIQRYADTKYRPDQDVEQVIPQRAKRQARHKYAVSRGDAMRGKHFACAQQPGFPNLPNENGILPIAACTEYSSVQVRYTTAQSAAELPCSSSGRRHCSFGIPA